MWIRGGANVAREWGFISAHNWATHTGPGALPRSRRLAIVVVLAGSLTLIPNAYAA